MCDQGQHPPRGDIGAVERAGRCGSFAIDSGDPARANGFGQRGHRAERSTSLRSRWLRMYWLAPSAGGV